MMVGILRAASLPVAVPFVFPFTLSGASEDVAGDKSGVIASEFLMVCRPEASELGEAPGWVIVTLEDGSGLVP